MVAENKNQESDSSNPDKDYVFGADAYLAIITLYESHGLNIDDANDAEKIQVLDTDLGGKTSFHATYENEAGDGLVSKPNENLHRLVLEQLWLESQEIIPMSPRC